MPNNNNRINFQVGYNVDQASVNAVKKSLQDLQNIKFKDFNGPKQDLDDIKQKASQVEAALNKAFNVNLNSLNTQSFNVELQKAGLSIDKIYTSFSKAGAQGQVAFSRMASEVLTTNMQLKLTNSLVSQMGETMANTVKWGIASSVMNNFTNSVRQAFDYVKALDSSLNDIRIVTKQSSDLMANFAVQANNSAQALGRSTMDYTKAALTFYQQGLDEASVQARTESVLKAQNITGAGLEMADYLTAVWNGYKVANEEAELYVDKLAAVADSSASNMSLLAIAMSKVASSANLLGVPVDNLNAQIATIVATTRQAPESVGNALKTIYSRINDIATGADDAEISLGNYSAKMALVGISVLDANGRLRDTGDVIDEIGGKWETLSHEQQIYLARTMAGQRQYNNLLALFENWGKYSDLVNVSMEAQGATALKNAIYMESLSAKMEQLGAAGEKVKAALIDEDDLKGLVDFGTGAVNLFGNLIESIGGGRGALLAFGSIFTQVFSGTIAKELNNTITNFQNVRNNVLILKNDIKATLTFGASQGYSDGAIKLMVDAKRQMQLYYSIMSALQINSYNNIIKLVGASKELVLILKEQVELALKFALALQKASLQEGQTGNLTDQIALVNQEAENLKATLDSLKGKNALQLFNDSDQDIFGNIIDQVELLRKSVGLNTIPAFKDFDKAVLQVANTTNITVKELSIFRTAAEKVFNQVYSGNNLVLGLDETKVKLNLANASLLIAKQKINEYKKSIEQFSNVKGIVDTASALGRLASGLNSIKNLGNIWTNLNLSNGEKFLQTITNLGMAIPMLASAYKTLQKTTLALSNSMVNQAAIQQAMSKVEQADLTVKTLKTSIEQAEIAAKEGNVAATSALVFLRLAESKATLLAAAAQTALNAAMSANPIGAIITGITLAVTAIYGLVKVYDHFTMSVKEADLAIEAFNQKQKLIADGNANLASQTAELESIKDLYELLAEKAGAINFDSNIDSLTLAERQRYNLLKGIIAKYNEDAIAGYNAQGLAILNNNTYIEDQIQLLKDKRQAEIDSYVSSEEFLKADKGYQVKASQAQSDYKSFQQYKEDTNWEELFNQYLGLIYFQFAENNFDLSYNEILFSLEEITSQGIDGLQKNLNKLQDINNQAKLLGKNTTLNSTDIDYYISQLADMANLDVEESKLKESAELAVKIPIDIILTRLKSSEYNTLYNELSLVYGLAMITSMIKSYILGVNNGEGFIYSEDFGSIEAVLQIREQFLKVLSLVNISDKDLKIFSDKAISFGLIDFSSSTIQEYRLQLLNFILLLYSLSSKLQQLRNKDESAFNSLISNIFGLDNISTSIDEQGNLFIEEVSNGTLTKYEEAQNKAIEKINLQFGKTQKGQQLRSAILNSDSFQIENLDAILELALKLPQSEANAWEIATAKVKLYGLAQANFTTMGHLSNLATGDIDDLNYDALVQELNSLAEKYPLVSNQVKILETDWMRSTSTYQDALRDVNNLLLETTQKAVLDQALTQELASLSLQGLIGDSETLQNALNKELLTFEGYSNTLGNLASQYESCQTELNNFVHALQNGDEQTLANAAATLTLSLRAAELSEITNISGDRIERVAEQLAKLNPYLEQNTLLAADAAVRYIRLNESIEDLYTNAEDYRQLLSEIAEDGSDAIYANEELFESFLNIKDVVANVFDTSADALGDDWIIEHLELIILMALQGGLGFELLRQAASLEILINTGIDMSNFYISLELFLSRIGELEEGADINCLANLDILLFVQQLVTALEQAGFAQTEIDRILTGLQLDVDLAPYEEGLNQAIDDAMEAGKLASDNFASNAGVNVKTNTETQEVPQQTIIPGQEYDVGYQYGDFVYPQFSVSPGILPNIGVSVGHFTSMVPIYRPRPITQTVEGNVQTAATGLLVIGASKSSGGKISHRNSPGSRAARSPSKGRGGGGGGKGSTPKAATQAKVSTAKIETTAKTPSINPYEQELKSYLRQSKILDDLLDQLKKLVNKDRLKNLQEQNKTLREQEKILNRELAISANSAAENSTADYARRLRQLFGDAFGLDADGQIKDVNALERNAAEVYNAAAKAAADAFNKLKLAYNNYILNTWNAYGTQDEQELHKAEKEMWDQRLKDAELNSKNAIKAAEEEYKTREDLINSYTKAWEADQKRLELIKEIQDQIIENQIAASKIKVDLAIDTGDFERNWLDFENKFIKKLDKDDFLGSAKASAKELMSYFNSKQVQETADEIRKLRNEINIMQRGGTSSIYGTNLAQAQEDLENYMKQQMDDLTDIQDLVDDIKDNYLDALDDAKDKMDDQINQYERVNDLIDHNVKLTLLMYGDTAYNTMEKYYELQKANNKDLLDSLRLQQQYWQDLMKNLAEHSPAWEEMKKNLDDITDELNKKLEDMIENLSDQWKNRVDGIIARLNNGLTGGRGLDFLDEQWDYINNFDDNFLDTFESKMGIQEVTDLYQLAIDGLSGSPANQQKINKLMNEQLKILREKDNLTQYDIDRAKAALEVEKARMALEDARYNKTKMRLRRDSQGNYTYQYVADEEKLGDLQAALADAQANLYNMDKEHYTQNLNSLYDAYKDYIDKMRELTEEYNSTQDEEERARIQSRIDLLRESTNKLMQGLTEDNKYALQYLNESFFGGMGIDTNLLSAELQMELMINNVPQMQSNIQDLANTLVGEGGILNATNDAMKEISDATVEYDNNVRQFLQDAGSSLEIVTNVTDAAGNALDQNVVNAQNLITANDELIKSCEAQVAAIQELMNWLDQYMNKVMNVLTLVANLRSAYGTGQQLNGSNLTADVIPVTKMGLDTTTGSDFTGNPVIDAAAVKQQIDLLMAQYEQFLKQMSIATFDTGGSTGSWGDASGRLAFLHEKELVLNQQDTANILAAVNAVRMITGSLNGLATGEIGSLINNATGLLGGIDTNNTLDQNVHIEANFPNVTQHTEIEQAFNNLVNMASMKASGYRD